MPLGRRVALEGRPPPVEALLLNPLHLVHGDPVLPGDSEPGCPDASALVLFEDDVGEDGAAEGNGQFVKHEELSEGFRPNSRGEDITAGQPPRTSF